MMKISLQATFKKTKNKWFWLKVKFVKVKSGVLSKSRFSNRISRTSNHSRIKKSLRHASLVSREQRKKRNSETSERGEWSHPNQTDMCSRVHCSVTTTHSLFARSLVPQCILMLSVNETATAFSRCSLHWTSKLCPVLHCCIPRDRKLSPCVQTKLGSLLVVKFFESLWILISPFQMFRTPLHIQTKPGLYPDILLNNERLT